MRRLTFQALMGLGLCLLALGVLPHKALAANPAVVVTDQVRAELVVHAPQGLKAGQAAWLGLKIEHAEHWHTYWRNPGDSGLPTTLDFQMPEGFAVGDIAWPTPQRLPIGPLVNYGYEGRLLLAVPLQVPADFKGDNLEVKLRADWLVCKDVCIPEGGDFVLRVPAQASSANHATLFEATRKALPQAADSSVKAVAKVEGGQLIVRVSALPSAWASQKLQAFPELAGVIDNAAPPQSAWQADGSWELRWALSAQRSESPTALPLLLAKGDGRGGDALTLQANVEGGWPPIASSGGTGAVHLGNAQISAGGDFGGSSSGLGLAAAMGLALLGGMLLNLMPCVFPVLSLKLLGFAQHAGDTRKLLAGGLAYSAGVIASFVALAALLLALRAGGEQLGWGFQLQQPLVVVALAALFTLIGLNLAGVFEIGSLLPSSVATARARHPLLDSALTGVLAVAVASPCTAPFMGASLGLAATLPAAQALAVFAALGLGMALPYLAASAWPGLARALPKPGVWMLHFKVLMAFPMLATVVWLVWVLGQQVGIDGAAALLLMLVLLAFAAWALGAPSLGRRARRGFGAVAAVLLASALAWGWPAWQESAGSSVQETSPDPTWQPWSAEKVAQAQAGGQPVFVDFTAAWCVTCQVNKRGALANSEVLKAFGDKNVLLLRADWTRRDAAIGQTLAALGRSGIPVYALYSPGQAQPQLLSEILSTSEVLASLSRLP